MSSRRCFLGGAGAAAMNQLVQPRAFGVNDKIRVAVLGVNGRGTAHIAGIQGQPDAEVAILCHPDPVVLARRAGEFEKKFGRNVQTETDPRKVFDNKEIDAVTIATPNHWHALAAIWACQAGKDVYVEKPGAHSIYGGRKLVEAAHKYNRIMQHGVQPSDQNGPVETAHLSSALAHLGNISYRLGRQLEFDPKTERFPHDEQANAMLKRNYRAPYVVPEKV